MTSLQFIGYPVLFIFITMLSNVNARFRVQCPRPKRFRRSGKFLCSNPCSDACLEFIINLATAEEVHSMLRQNFEHTEIAAFYTKILVASSMYHQYQQTQTVAADNDGYYNYSTKSFSKRLKTPKRLTQTQQPTIVDFPRTPPKNLERVSVQVQRVEQAIKDIIGGNTDKCLFYVKLASWIFESDSDRVTFNKMKPSMCEAHAKCLAKSKISFGKDEIEYKEAEGVEKMDAQCQECC